MATTEKTANYTEAQENMIRAAAADGPLDLAKATALADSMGKKPRSIIAKAVRMEIPYAKKKPLTKSGEPVTQKADLVDDISRFVAGNLDGLEKASKPALQNILAAFTVMSE